MDGVSLSTADERNQELLRFFCSKIKQMDKASPDRARRIRSHVIGVANDALLEYVNANGMKGTVTFCPVIRSRVIWIGDTEYRQEYSYSLETEHGRAKTLEGIQDLTFLDALMRIGGYKPFFVLIGDVKHEIVET